jgi:CubicO group peptidase (beta-lactamase class C family)
MSSICFGFNIHAMSHQLETLPLELNLSIEEIDDIAKCTLQKFNVPGASINVVFNDQSIFSQGYGFRDLDKKLPVTESTLFPIASCTKAFTAIALGLLVDEGSLKLDDPVQKYIPEFYLVNQDRTNHLTIRDLLAHRTGLARHDPIWFFSDISRASVIGLLKNLEPACDLRQDFQYNNLMYTVAGIIVERVTGQSWEEAISSRLFKPLEMKNSITSLEELQNRLDFSLPYAEINGKITNIPFRNTFSVNPGGGIISNALDMGNWLKFQLGQGKLANDFIQRQIFEETHTIQMPFSSLPNENEKMHHIGYGLGWFIGKYREYDFISHGGDIDGFSSEVAFLPEKKIGLVILTNSSTDGRYAISAIRNLIFDKILGINDIDWTSKNQEICKKTKNALREALELLAKNDQIPSNLSLESFVGVYAHPAYGNVEIKIENGYLLASYGKITTPLYFKSDSLFAGKFCELLVYGINPFIDFKFFRDTSDFVYKMEIPFEGFRSSKPITFNRTLL